MNVQTLALLEYISVDSTLTDYTCKEESKKIERKGEDSWRGGKLAWFYSIAFLISKIIFNNLEFEVYTTYYYLNKICD